MKPKSSRPRTRMIGNAPRLAAYAAVLAACFAAGAGIAAAVGPIDSSGGTHADPHEPAPGVQSGVPHLPGISIDANGFRIVPTSGSLAAGTTGTYSFRIVSRTGDTVTDFDSTHQRELHLIFVSRNLVDYQHLHPTRDGEGVWTAEVPPLPSGSYRVFADTRPTGADDVTLGVDLAVNGASAADPPVGPPDPQRTVAVDGYSVTMTGTAGVGQPTLGFSIERSGTPITPDPYLGASGHLVALRAGDLAFLHVHPLGDATRAEPAIRFAAEFPTPGTYRLFLDVSLDATVRTFAFTVEVPETASPHLAGGNDISNDIDNANDHEEGH